MDQDAALVALRGVAEGEPADGPWRHTVRERARAALAQPEPEGLPPGYIDAEHTGHDRGLLDTFYQACRSEGGTADEINLRGLKAVLAHVHQVQPEPEGPTDEELNELMDSFDWQGYPNLWGRKVARAVLARWGRPTPQPADGEVAELVDKCIATYAEDPSIITSGSYMLIDDGKVRADLLSSLSPPQPIPVIVRLPGPGDCDAEGRCWWGRAESDDWSADWTLATPESVAEFCEFSPQVVWLPAHALPLPSASI
jgi:hypothetical protein